MTPKTTMNQTSLVATSLQMRMQNNRATQHPLFIIQERVKEVCAEGYEDGYMFLTEDCLEMEEEELCEDCASDDSRKAPCVGCGFYRREPFKFEWKTKDRYGVFFTEKACVDCLNSNRHHFNGSTRTFVIGAWRNPEMVAVMQAIIKLTGEAMPDHYL